MLERDRQNNLAYAVILDSSFTVMESASLALAGILEGFPYFFKVVRLVDETARLNETLQALEALQKLSADARILLFVAGQTATDRNDNDYLLFADTDPNNLQASALPLNKLFSLSKTLLVQHLAIVLDMVIDLPKYEQFLEFGAPSVGNPLHHKAHLLVVRRMETQFFLSRWLVEQLEDFERLEPLGLYSLWYHTAVPDAQLFYFQDITVSENRAGDFIFYDPPLAHLPISLRTGLLHSDPLVRQLAVTEAEHFLDSIHHRKYVEQALEELFISDSSLSVRLRIEETLYRKQLSTTPISLKTHEEVVRNIIGEPFKWAFIPAGRTTLIDMLYSPTTDGDFIGYQREYIPDKLLNYLPRGGKTHLVAAFAMARFTISNAQFQVFLEDDYRNPRWWQFSLSAQNWYQENVDVGRPDSQAVDHPAVNVTWYEVMAFCLWLSDKSGLTIMLPDERQWQRAAQGDDHRLYAWGNTYPDDSVAQWQSSDAAPVDSHVLQAQASPFGLYHMSGNVFEWCTTKYHSGLVDLESANDSLRLIRGGSWNSTSEIPLQTTYRSQRTESIRDSTLGFRIICQLEK